MINDANFKICSNFNRISQNSNDYFAINLKVSKGMFRLVQGKFNTIDFFIKPWEVKMSYLCVNNRMTKHMSRQH